MHYLAASENSIPRRKETEGHFFDRGIWRYQDFRRPFGFARQKHQPHCHFQPFSEFFPVFLQGVISYHTIFMTSSIGCELAIFKKL